MLVPEDAEAKSQRRRSTVSRKLNKPAHSHDHNHHDHDHHDHHDHDEKGFTFSGGFSISQGFGGSSASSEESGSHAGHQHLTGPESFSLHNGDGESHGGESGAKEGENGSTLEPTLLATVGYKFSKRLALNLDLSYGFSTGIGDPSLGLAIRGPKIGSVSSTIVPSITAPLSKASRESYKVTTFSLSYNPTWKVKRLAMAGTLGISKSYYSKTIIVDEDEDEEALTGLRSRQMLQEEEEEGELEAGAEDVGTGDREFDRYTIALSGDYPIYKRWTLGSGYSLAFVKMQFGPSQIESTFTALKTSYTRNHISGTLSGGLFASDKSFVIPNKPIIGFSLLYIFE